MTLYAPLAHAKVVDLSRYAPGLFATTLLSDLGASVVSVESPGAGGDDLPLYASNRARREGVHPFYRRRRSIQLDLRQADAVAVVRRLAGLADVFVEGFRPGVADRMGLGFAELASVNPSLVYCSITGYGQSGEDAQRPGHDINYVAEAGALALGSDGTQNPLPPANLIADLAGGGLSAAFAIAAALAAKLRGASAQHLDVSMTRSVLNLVAPAAAMSSVGSPDPSWGQGLLSGRAPFYATYRAADGNYLAVGAIEAKFFAELCRVIGCEDLIDVQLDESHWPRIREELTRVFQTRPRDYWIQHLASAAVTPVRTVTEALSGPADGRPVSPAELTLLGHGDIPSQYARYPGQDTRTVLADLGYDDDAIESLIDRGIAHESSSTP